VELIILCKNTYEESSSSHLMHNLPALFPFRIPWKSQTQSSEAGNTESGMSVEDSLQDVQ
jgi:hypothetical protein